jgi:hypothetical protein
VHPDGEPAVVDAGPDLHREVERGRADLLKPEAELVHQVEREAVETRRTGGCQRRLELDGLARAHEGGKRRARAVPEDGVPERVEPVVRELDSLASTRAPRRRTGVLEPDAGRRRHTRTLLGDLVRLPPNRERARGNRVLADALHRRAYSRFRASR